MSPRFDEDYQSEQRTHSGRLGRPTLHAARHVFDAEAFRHQRLELPADVHEV